MGQLVTLTVCYSVPEAHVIVSTLSARGVPSFPLGLGHAAISWYLIHALGGIEIRVVDADYDSAFEILQLAEEPVDRFFSDAEAFKRRPAFNAIVLLFLYFFGIGAPFWIRKKHRFRLKGTGL